ncbi:putative nudix domain-containing protein [Botrytis fragariae]|uniref:Putative nudix domain-containing protein n=1 Tax=Botrytis fragariae TaxID=1964551 RepID=A0A8H6EH44_9HELO|nr:putative nudix domain-containing protein [Botrytis fragariae]KAF5872099.1 putative nudix domain-containing protein [Botrytis fragariae]
MTLPGSPSPRSDLEKQYTSSTSSSKVDRKATKEIAVPQPSSSILLISPQNQILLLHRIRTSSSFPSAHVFPGGNLDPYHESPIPSPSSPSRHVDSEIYRLGAIRECFEESGILLALPSPSASPQNPEEKTTKKESLHIDEKEISRARKEIHSRKVKFSTWLAQQGGIPDIESLHPFTRWITPSNLPKRFTTQMYIYFLPLSSSPSPSTSTEVENKSVPTIQETEKEQETHTIPTHDGGIEHTAAEFAYCSTWLEKARSGEIILFPPQFYLMELLSKFLLPAESNSNSAFSIEELSAQRTQVLQFLQGDGGDASGILWGEKVMSPLSLGIKKKNGDGRVILGLDGQGPELEGVGRKGDGKRVVLVRFGKEGPREVEVRERREVLEEERGGEAKL